MSVHVDDDGQNSEKNIWDPKIQLFFKFFLYKFKKHPGQTQMRLWRLKK